MGLFESSSSWILALGKTLLHSLWAGLLVYSIVRLLFFRMAAAPAPARYRVAFGSLLVFTAAMTAVFLGLYDPVAPVSAAVLKGYAVIPGRPQKEHVAGLTWWVCVGATWLYMAGIMLEASRHIIGWARVAGIRKAAVPPSGKWTRTMSELARKTGIRRKVRLLCSVTAPTAFLTGLFRPVVIVPAAMLSQLPAPQVEIILLHELHHLRRLDHVALVLQRFITLVFFYHPAIRAIGQLTDNEREHSCDEHILSSGHPPIEYARVLYELARVMNDRTFSPALAATGKKDHHLQKRISRILNQEIMKSNRKEKGTAVALLGLALALVLIMSGFSAGQSIQTYKQSPPVQAPVPEQPVPPDSLEEIHQEALQKGLEEARRAMEEIDWEQIKNDLEEARIQALEGIDWESIREEIKESQRLMEEIDWEQMHESLTQLHMELDSLHFNFDFDFDHDFDFDFDFDHEFEAPAEAESDHGNDLDIK